MATQTLAKEIAQRVGLPLVFRGVWKDNHYPTTANNGVGSDRCSALEAFADAKRGAEATGFSMVDYYVTAVIGDDEIIITRIKNFEGIT